MVSCRSSLFCQPRRMAVNMAQELPELPASMPVIWRSRRRVSDTRKIQSLEMPIFVGSIYICIYIYSLIFFLYSHIFLYHKYHKDTRVSRYLVLGILSFLHPSCIRYGARGRGRVGGFALLSALAKLMADPKLAIFRKIVGASTVMVPSGSADLHTWDLWFLFWAEFQMTPTQKLCPSSDWWIECFPWPLWSDFESQAAKKSQNPRNQGSHHQSRIVSLHHSAEKNQLVPFNSFEA